MFNSSLKTSPHFSAWPLQRALIVPLAALFVGAVALVGYDAYRIGKRTTETIANELLHQTSERVTAHLDQHVQASQQFVAAGRLAVEQGMLDPNNPEQLRQFLWWHMISNPEQPEVGFRHIDGADIGYMQINVDVLRQLVEQISGQSIPPGTLMLRQASANQQQYFRTEADGSPSDVIYQKAGDHRNAAWFQKALAQPQQQWVPISSSWTTPILQLTAAAPVYDNSAALQGFFYAHYRLADLSDFLSRIDISPNGEVFIVEQSGALVATSVMNESTALLHVGGQTQRILAVESQNEHIRSVAQNLVNTHGTLEPFAASEQFNWVIDGQRKFVQITPYQDDYGLDWLLAVAIPASDFRGGFNRSIRNSVLLKLVMIGAVVAASLVLSRRFARRLATLNQATQALASGDLKQTFSTNSSIAEVQGLAASFNQVAEQLRCLFQHQVEAEVMRQSEQRFQEIASTINQFFFVRSAETQQFIYLSPAFETIWGYPCERLYDNPDAWMDAIHPDDRPFVEASLAQQRAGQSVAREYRIIRSDGSIRWISAQIQLVRDKTGRPLRFIGTAEDVSQRKAAEAELDRFFSVALDLLCIANTDGYFLRLNPQWEKTLGYSIGELEGSRFLDYVHPEDVDFTLKAISYLLQHKELDSFVNRYRCRDGSYRWIEWRSVLVGSVIYAAARDITQRQQLEADLRRLNQRLQKLATLDSLTQLANRRQMELHLQQEWQRCQRIQAPLTLALLDIDHFKLYNDFYGHLQGDACLQKVASVLQGHVNRPGDLVSRYGGEEFLIVWPLMDQTHAIGLVENIRQSLAQAQIPHQASPTHEYVTISLGVAVIQQMHHFSGPAAAIAVADELLYQAKQTRDAYRLRVI